MEDKKGFDETAWDPCWDVKCGGNCSDCGNKERRVNHFIIMGY